MATLKAKSILPLPKKGKPSALPRPPPVPLPLPKTPPRIEYKDVKAPDLPPMAAKGVKKAQLALPLPPRTESMALPLPPRPEPPIKVVVVSFINYKDRSVHPYAIELKKGQIIINGKRLVVKTFDEMNEDEKEVYGEYARRPDEVVEEGEEPTPEGRPEVGRLWASLHYYYDEEHFPYVAGDGSMMGLFDAIIYRLLNNEPLAPRYIIDKYEINVEGSSEPGYSLPTTGSDLGGFDFQQLLTDLNHFGKLDVKLIPTLPPAEQSFRYENNLGRSYDDTKAVVKSVTFPTVRYPGDEETISFPQPVTEKKAIEAAETFLSEPLTREYYDARQEDLFDPDLSYDEYVEKYGAQPRGDILSDAIFLERAKLKDGNLQLVFGS